MGKRKRAIRNLRRRVAALEADRTPSAPVEIDQPRCDPQAMWRDHVQDYSHGWEDDCWNHGGYL